MESFFGGADVSDYGSGTTSGSSASSNMGGSGPGSDSFVSAALNMTGAAKQNAANRGAAANANRFTQDMSSTSWQRGVADMIAAGINPMFAASKGGADSGSGAVAKMENVLSGAVASAQSGAVVRATLAKIEAEANQSNSQAALNAAAIPKVVADTQQSQASAGQLQQLTAQSGVEIERIWQEIEKSKQEVKTSATQADRNKAEEKLAVATSKLRPAQARLTTAEGTLSQLAIPQARNLSNQQGSWWMRFVSPYLPDFLKSVTSAVGLRGMSR